MKIAQLTVPHFLCLLCLMPVPASAQPFLISADGSEVSDQKTGLIWRRCSEGMTWDGSTCAGVASTFNHETALRHAANQASNTGIAWRLPNVKELSSIADRARSNPAIDPTAFPATPAISFWSASPKSYTGISTHAWRVNFVSGTVYGVYRIDSNNSVRLVRNGP